jgi:hypothetical protein
MQVPICKYFARGAQREIVIMPWAFSNSHPWRRLAKQPSSVSDDAVPRGCRVSRVAQRVSCRLGVILVFDDTGACYSCVGHFYNHLINLDKINQDV